MKLTAKLMLMAGFIAAQAAKFNDRVSEAILRQRMGIQKRVSKHRNSRANRGRNCGPGRIVPPIERRSVYRALKAQAKRMGVAYDN